MSKVQTVSKWTSRLMIATFISFEMIWRLGGVALAYWIGRLLISLFFITPVISLLFSPDFSIGWMQIFTAVNNGKTWYELTGLQQSVYYVIAFVTMLIGMLLLYVGAYALINNCLPSEPCIVF